jgi:hypothetical protein
MHSSICACKRQKRQGLILSGDKIVPAEHPAGHGTGVDADLEVKRPSQVRNRKWLQPDIGRTGSSDRMETIDTTQIQTRIGKQPRRKGTAIAGARLSTCMQLPNSFSSYYLP